MKEEGIHIALKAEQLTELFGIPITNTMLMSWLVMVVLITLGYVVGRNLTKIPNKVQTFFETVFGFILDYLEEVLESRVLALRFFPLIVTLFLFILLGNWSGLFPGVGSLYVEQPAHAAEEVEPSYATDPLFRDEAPATAHVEETKEAGHKAYLFHPISTDLNVTLALAIIAFLAIEFAGVYYVGAMRYVGKFFSFKSPLAFFVGIIELISELARLISFSFRLFGNMFAGKTLLLVAMFFVPYFLPIPLLMYEVLVGFIQASIFALLTLFFVKLAVSEAH